MEGNQTGGAPRRAAPGTATAPGAPAEPWAALAAAEGAVVWYRVSGGTAGEALDARVLDASPGALAAFGVSRDQLLGREASELLGPHEIAPFLSAAAAVLATGGARALDAERDGRVLRLTVLRTGPDVVAVVSHAPTVEARAAAEGEHAAELLELGDAFLELDSSWRIVRVNANQERLSRTPRARSLGRVFWDVWPETASPESTYHREYHRCMEARVPVQFVEYFAPLDLWTGVTAYPIHGGGIAVFFRDVSAVKRAEQRLRDGEEKLRLAKDAARMGAWDWDLVTGELVWTERCKALFGLPPDAPVTYEGFLAALVPEDRPRVEEAVGEAIEHGTDYDVEMRVRLPAGRIRWVASHGRAFRDEAGRAVRMAGMALDVSGQKCTEEALRASEARARAISTNIPDDLVILEAVRSASGEVIDWRYRDANEGTLALLRTTRDALIGRTLAEVLPDRFAALSERMGRVHATGVPDRYESTIGGETLLVSLFRIDADTVGGAALDITARKRAEDALRAANARLLEADRRKNEFLGMLSHELRNPLAPIWNSIYILDHAAPASDRARRAREVIGRQAGHLGRLVDDLLDVTRIARGKVELRRARVDLADLVRRTGEDHRGLLAEHGVALRVELPAAPAWVLGDVTRVAQIIGNLLQNAAKFTPEGGTVTLSLAAGPASAELRVRDTGAGIAPALLEHIFEPFTQGEQDLARTSGGLGLGLALVKGLAQLHGGTARASSEGPGRGAELVVTLPLASAAPAPEPAAPRPAPGAGGRRVLVVDDNHDAAESLAELVALFGHRAEVAFDGPSALEKVRASRPDVLLCDIGLPGMSGYDVARAIRAEGARAPRLVALSGYAEPQDVQAAAEAGFDLHVAKPPSPATLEQILSS